MVMFGERDWANGYAVVFF